MAQYVPENEIGVFGLLKSKKENEIGVFGLLKSKKDTQPGFKELIYIPQPHFVNGCSLESSMGAEKRESRETEREGRGGERKKEEK